MKNLHVAGAVLTAAILLSAPAFAAQCNPKGGFNAFIADMKKEAAAKGISRRGISALDGLTLDDSVLAADRRQHVFKQSFEEFSGRMISKSRVEKGQRMLAQHATVIRRVEQQSGVPGAVVVALWGLETDYGTNQGTKSVIRSTATLAFDCRRTDRFQAELLDALRIVDRGDMHPEDMRGHWAGEIGQTQFLPSSYVAYAVDGDGDGRRDLVRSSPDVIASTANYLKGKGWQRGQGWQPGQPNFDVIKQWNKADVYARTIAAFAERLDGGKTAKATETKPAAQPAPAKPNSQKPAMRDRRAMR